MVSMKEEPASSTNKDNQKKTQSTLPKKETKKCPRLPSGKFGEVRSKREQREILTQIEEGIIAGKPNSTLIEELKLPQTTFYRYLDKIIEENKAENLERKDRLLHAYHTRTMGAYRRVFKLAKETNNPKAFKAASDIVQDMFDRLQSVGFIPTAKIEVDEKITHDASKELTDFIWGKKKVDTCKPQE